MNDRAVARLLILCGPAAVGKGTVVGSLCERYPSQFYFLVSAIIRQPRPGEVEGKPYSFVPREKFQGLIDLGGMLGRAEAHQQNLYRTPTKPVGETLTRGLPVSLEIDLDGFYQIRAARPEAHSILLLSPSWEELKRRLIGRGTESTEEQHCRLETVRVELAAQNEFDELVVNNNLADAVFALVKSTGLAQNRIP